MIKEIMFLQEPYGKPKAPPCMEDLVPGAKEKGETPVKGPGDTALRETQQRVGKPRPEDKPTGS